MHREGPSPRPGHMVLADEGEEDRAIGFVTSGGHRRARACSELLWHTCLITVKVTRFGFKQAKKKNQINSKKTRFCLKNNISRKHKSKLVGKTNYGERMSLYLLFRICLRGPSRQTVRCDIRLNTRCLPNS